MQTCPDCGCRVYKLGCVNCDEPNYIEEQVYLDSLPEEYDRPEPPLPDGRNGYAPGWLGVKG